MKNNNEYLTKADLQFLYSQRARILIHIFIGCAIIYILANFFMLFTKIVFFIGLFPIAVGLGYTIINVKRIIKETREYWLKK